MDPLEIPEGVILLLGSAITTVFIGPWLSALNFLLWWVWILYPLSEPGDPDGISTCDAQLTFDYIIHFTLLIILGTIAGFVFKLAGGIPQLLPFSIESGHSLEVLHRKNHIGLPVLSLSIMILFQSIFIATGQYYDNSDVIGSWFEAQEHWVFVPIIVSSIGIILVFVATYLEWPVFAIRYTDDHTDRSISEQKEMKSMIFFFIVSISLMMATYMIPAFLAGIWAFWLVWVLQAAAIAIVIVAMYFIPFTFLPRGFTAVVGSTASGISWDIILLLIGIGTVVPALLVSVIMSVDVTDIQQYQVTIYGLFAIWMIISAVAFYLRRKGNKKGGKRHNVLNRSEERARTKIGLHHDMFH